jgi:hypothetical protein
MSLRWRFGSRCDENVIRGSTYPARMTEIGAEKDGAMSSCAASCCICSLSASSAFATLVSSPTDGARFCCHFASQRSVRYRHKLNQKCPPIILLAIASCTLTVVPRW